MNWIPRIIIALSLAGATLSAAVVEEPTSEEIWQLVREAYTAYDAIDGVDYLVPMTSPEVEELIRTRTAGIPVRPRIVMERRNFANTLTIQFPTLPPPFRQKAEERAEQEVSGVEAFKVVQNLGWTMFGSFLRTVEATQTYDLIGWDERRITAEFNDLNEPFFGTILRSCRVTFERKKGLIEGMYLWFGGDKELQADIVSGEGVFPGTIVPLVRQLRITQNGFRGPPTLVLNPESDSVYERSTNTKRQDQHTSVRARLARSGLNRWQVDRARIDPQGGIALDLSGMQVGTMPRLQGFPIHTLNLAGAKVTDLKWLSTLPLRSLDLSKTQVSDLSPLEGMPIEHLVLTETPLKDFRALAKLPLRRLDLLNVRGFQSVEVLKGKEIEELNLQWTGVSDIASLVGMPLRVLNLSGTPVRDLAPLRGSPLERLDLKDTQVADLYPLDQCKALSFLRIVNSKVTDLLPLKGLPLRALRAGINPIDDIAALAGMPLEEISLDGTSVRDLSPLLACKNLVRLSVPTAARNIGTLKQLASLQDLSFKWDNERDVPAETAADFWTANDDPSLQLRTARAEELMIALRRAGITTMPQANANGTFVVNLERKPVEDLAFLEGFPISDLDARNTRVRDLSPLRGMPLKSLNLSDTPVSDISPLAGVALETLALSGTNVEDLSAIERMPLRRLFLDRCPKLRDIGPLARNTVLDAITLPPRVQDYEFLKKLPSLTRLGFYYDTGKAAPAQFNADFWRDQDRWHQWRRNFVNLLDALEREKIPVVPNVDGGGSLQLELIRLPVTEISFLKGVLLSKLVLGECPVRDITPLRGMPLQELRIWRTQVEDLSPVAGSRLRILDASGSPIKSIAVLEGMPLEECYLQRCMDISDIRVLERISTLRVVLLPPGAEYDFLRGHPTIGRLGFKDFASSLPVAEFWRLYGSESRAKETGMLKDLEQGLQAMGITARPATDIANMMTTLSLDRTPISDLSILRGQRLHSLSLNTTKVQDLEPLRGMPLKNLNLSGTDVRSVEPLHGMQLERLELNGTLVSDLSPLRGMKLMFIGLGRKDAGGVGRSTNISDLSALQGMPFTRASLDGTIEPDVSVLLSCPALELVILPTKVRNLDSLRKHPKLRGAAFGWPGSWEAIPPMAQFWASVDGSGRTP